jgi:hypothetical protein
MLIINDNENVYNELYHDGIIAAKKANNEFPFIVLPAFTKKFCLKSEYILII